MLWVLIKGHEGHTIITISSFMYNCIRLNVNLEQSKDSFHKIQAGCKIQDDQQSQIGSDQIKSNLIKVPGADLMRKRATELIRGLTLKEERQGM